MPCGQVRNERADEAVHEGRGDRVRRCVCCFLLLWHDWDVFFPRFSPNLLWWGIFLVETNVATRDAPSEFSVCRDFFPGVILALFAGAPICGKSSVRQEAPKAHTSHTRIHLALMQSRGAPKGILMFHQTAQMLEREVIPCANGVL